MKTLAGKGSDNTKEGKQRAQLSLTSGNCRVFCSFKCVLPSLSLSLYSWTLPLSLVRSLPTKSINFAAQLPNTKCFVIYTTNSLSGTAVPCPAPHAHAPWPWDQSNAGTLERLLKKCRTCTIMFIKCHLLIRYIMLRRDLGCSTAVSCACWGRG